MRMFGLYHDPVGAVFGLIDGAHATLHTKDLADPLLRVRPLRDELLGANASRAREWWDDGIASPAVRVYLRPIHEVAARPRGSAVAGGVRPSGCRRGVRRVRRCTSRRRDSHLTRRPPPVGRIPMGNRPGTFPPRPGRQTCHRSSSLDA